MDLRERKTKASEEQAPKPAKKARKAKSGTNGRQGSATASRKGSATAIDSRAGQPGSDDENAHEEDKDETTSFTSTAPSDEDSVACLSQDFVFFLGAKQANPPQPGVFYWLKNESNRLSNKLTLPLPLTLDSLQAAIAPVYKAKCFRDYQSSDNHLGVVLPFMEVPAGDRKKKYNTVLLLDGEFKLDSSEGSSLDVVVIPIPRVQNRQDPSSHAETPNKDSHHKKFTVTVVVGGVLYNNHYLTEVHEHKKTTGKSPSVRVGDFETPVEVDEGTGLTYNKVVEVVEKLYQEDFYEDLDLRSADAEYELRLVSDHDKQPIGESKSSTLMMTCDHLLPSNYRRMQPGHVSVVLMRKDVVDGKSAKSHGSSTDRDRQKKIAVTRLANEESAQHEKSGKYSDCMCLFDILENSNRDTKHRIVQSIFEQAINLPCNAVQVASLDWLKQQDVRSAQKLIEATLKDCDKIKDFDVQSGFSLRASGGGGNGGVGGAGGSGGRSLEAETTGAVSRLLVQALTRIKPNSPSSSNWAGFDGTITVGELKTMLKDLPKSELLLLQTSQISGPSAGPSRPVGTWMPLVRIVDEKGLDDSYFVVMSSDQPGSSATSVRISKFVVVDPVLEDGNPPLED